MGEDFCNGPGLFDGNEERHRVAIIHRFLVCQNLVTRKQREHSRKGQPVPVPLVYLRNDVHQIDFNVGHYPFCQRPVEVLTQKDLGSGLVSSKEGLDPHVQRVRAFLVRDWQTQGRPRFSQMDKDRGPRIKPSL